MKAEAGEHRASLTGFTTKASLQVLSFAVGGLFVGSLLGAVEGALWGLLILPVHPGELSVHETTRYCAVLCGALGGAAGLPAFLIVALKARPLHDASAVFASAAKRAALGSFKGAFAGAPIGGMGMVLFMFVYNVATHHSTAWGQLFSCLRCGIYLGALVGFIIGLCAGVSEGGTGEAKMQRLEADIEMHRQNIVTTSEILSSEKLSH